MELQEEEHPEDPKELDDAGEHVATLVVHEVHVQEDQPHLQAHEELSLQIEGRIREEGNEGMNDWKLGT